MHFTLRRRFYLPTASSDQLADLAAACEPATFGVDQKDVYDESYRKAGKMNVEDFSINFSPERFGLVRQIKNELLGWKDEARDIELELYKLNVYGERNLFLPLTSMATDLNYSRFRFPGKDCFFKSHKDTPRSKGMFGSLVVILPVSHEGGELRLRHNEREIVYDAAKALKEKEEENDTFFAYIAFYSDVEHEVMKVTSGFRVTLTYNLYFITRPVPRYLPPGVQSALTDVVRALLEDPEFLPNGAHLGFGLKHQYPVGCSEDSDLSHIGEIIKGADGAIAQAWADCGLRMHIRIIYETNHCEKIMCSEVPCYIAEDECSSLVDQMEGTLLKGSHEDDEGLDLIWVTESTKNNRFETPYAAYGNESSLSYIYGNVALIVDVGPFGNRQGPPIDDEGKPESE